MFKVGQQYIWNIEKPCRVVIITASMDGKSATCGIPYDDATYFDIFDHEVESGEFTLDREVSECN